MDPDPLKFGISGGDEKSLLQTGARVNKKRGDGFGMKGLIAFRKLYLLF